MGQAEYSDEKSKLVLEICSLTTSYIACAHKPPLASPPNKSHFIDWYRLLGVEESADVDVIRKRYHKLALLLHPDKNKHPRAEVAFKLVLEAYSCLADIAKRRAFDLERCKNFCLHCNKIPYTSCKRSRSSRESKLPGPRPASCSRILQGIKEMRERFREEVKVIESCLRANSDKRRGAPVGNPSNQMFQDKTNTTNCWSRRESPVFNPSDYKSDGYPHIRNQIFIKRPNTFWNLHSRTMGNNGTGRGHCDSLSFGNGSGARMFERETTCIRS